MNGQTVDASHRWITKEPNELLDGTFYIDVYSNHVPSSVVPVAATLTWGNQPTEWETRSTAPLLVSSHVTPGVWHRLAVTIPPGTHAPGTSGDYYIVLGSEGEFNEYQIMSATNWPRPGGPVWCDGNDLGWDWTPAQFAAAAANGYVTNARLNADDSWTYDAVYGANWVGISVVPEPASLVLLLISGAALLRRR